MRVITGSARGHKLIAPEGQETRPTEGKTKEAIFSMIASDIQNSIFLDLYSGSGAIGIEALSRGAKFCTFIDSSKKAIDTIKANLLHTKLIDKSKVIFGDVISQIKFLNSSKYDIIFLDPPYNKGYIEKTLVAIVEFDILAQNGYIVVEYQKNESVSVCKGLHLFKSKNYGLANIAFYRIDKEIQV